MQNPEQGTVLQELASVNLRIAREKTVPLPQELTAALRGHFIGMLLVGEPGSGKTTLLNRILRNEKGIRFAVIVNDLGEVNIDASLIQKGGVVGKKDGDGDLVALQNGCICCTLQTDLIDQLTQLASSGKFDYIVIEASGICDPAPIAQTICAMAGMDNANTPGAVIPRLDCIVTVVDALRMQSEFDCGEGLKNRPKGEEDIESLVIQQIEFCNVILLNNCLLYTSPSPRD